MNKDMRFRHFLKYGDVTKNTAHIRETVAMNAVGVREVHNVEWVGNSLYIYISDELLRDIVGVGGKITPLQIGPYKLIAVTGDIDMARGAWLYVRADRFGALRAWLYRATRWIDLVYRRCIITLAVWGLADYSQYTVPTWRDIHALKRWEK